jgi:hypothetical protein
LAGGALIGADGAAEGAEAEATATGAALVAPALPAAGGGGCRAGESTLTTATTPMLSPITAAPITLNSAARPDFLGTGADVVNGDDVIAAVGMGVAP